MTDFTPFTPGDYGEPRFLFTDRQHGHGPAVEWAQRHAQGAQGAQIESADEGQPSDDERQGALARLANTAEVQGWFAGEKR